eukprot:756013-Hanusia_phi.AAC.7
MRAEANLVRKEWSEERTGREIQGAQSCAGCPSSSSRSAGTGARCSCLTVRAPRECFTSGATSASSWTARPFRSPRFSEVKENRKLTRAHRRPT